MAKRLLILSIILLALLIASSFLSWLLPVRTLPIKLSETLAVATSTVVLPPSWHQVTPVPWAVRDSHTVFIFKNKLWFLGGLSTESGGKAVSMAQYAKATYYNDIWSSVDGENWKKLTDHAAFSPIRSASVIEREGVLYLLGGWSPELGYKNGIWKSTDGLNWEQVAEKVPFGEREGQKVIEFNGKLFLIGGVNYEKAQIFNDVWSSTDGINWQKEISPNPLRPENPWAPRWDHDVAVFQDKIWLAGGMAFGGVGFGDVWSSADGRIWNQELVAAPWGKRQGQILEVYKNRLWLVGGLGIEKNEVNGGTWSTTDGISWEQLPASESGETWLEREDHCSVVFHDKLWLLGGMDLNYRWTNDLWYLE